MTDTELAKYLGAFGIFGKQSQIFNNKAGLEHSQTCPGVCLPAAAQGQSWSVPQLPTGLGLAVQIHRGWSGLLELLLGHSTFAFDISLAGVCLSVVERGSLWWGLRASQELSLSRGLWDHRAPAFSTS